MNPSFRGNNTIARRASALLAQKILAPALLTVVILSAGTALAQSPTTKTPAARMVGDIDAFQRTTIVGTHPPLARAEFDAGRVPDSTRLEGITLVFNLSAAQEADLQVLLSAQQDESSLLYHHWLTPEDFATRFGVADSDLAKAQFWLQQQGFSIDSISRSKTRITFSGSVAQVEQAFSTEMHYYKVRGITHYAPFADLSLPATLAPMVTTVDNLATFRPHPHIVRPASPQIAPNPNFTSSQTQSHFLDPDDIATIYDIKPVYNAGFTGSGQSIAVVGQSAVVLSDIEHFQSALGFTVKDPMLKLVPSTGTSTISTGDESESDLDLEYSGGIARGATIIFVYVGNSANSNVNTALTYAVDNLVAPIISTSYGLCESDEGQAAYNSENGVLKEAAAQGQSVIAAAGDAGSTDCSGNTDQSTAAQEALAVDFPGSSQYVTAMGGTEFPDADVASTNVTYWTAAPTADIISSATMYIPEQVWNDDASTGTLSAGGGGASIFTPRPTWQTSVPGIPSGSFRLVPDISLSASPNNAGFLYCSSDTTVMITGSCSNGFRDANNKFLTTAGGTSFDVPIFAALVAIINQRTNSTGQGVVASTLYNLASNSTTYGSAFHDITSGSNECLAGASLCSTAGESSFAATTGYDEASGLGSIDFFNLLSAWPGVTSGLVATTTSLVPQTTTPASGASDAIQITVAASGTSTLNVGPTGTVSVAVDGVTVNSALALSSGVATYTFSSTTSGSHSVTATYSGDTNYSTSTGSVAVSIGSTTSKTFTMTATAATVSAGSSITSVVTVTPANGYTGDINFTVSVSPVSSDICFTLPSIAVNGTTAVTQTLTIFTSSTSCGGNVIHGAPGAHKIASLISAPSHSGTPSNSPLPVATFSLAGMLAIGLLGLRSRKLAAAGTAFLLVVVVSATLSGCSSASSSGGSTSSTVAAKGTYTVTVVGQDSATSSITATTTATLTIN